MQLFTEPWRAGAGISHAGGKPSLTYNKLVVNHKHEANNRMFNTLSRQFTTGKVMIILV